MKIIQAQPFDFEFDPSTTALLMIDMQRDFVEPKGFGEMLGNDVSLVRRCIAPCARVLAAARQAGLFVIHTREGHRPDLSDCLPAKLTRGGGGVGTLEVQESFDRAWRRVGLALDRVGFTVEDRDRSKGLYFVRYVDPETDGANKDPGLLSKLAFWKDAPPDPKTRYRIFVKDGGGTSSIQVLSTEGGIDQSETAKRILNLLFEQLK